MKTKYLLIAAVYVLCLEGCNAQSKHTYDDYEVLNQTLSRIISKTPNKEHLFYKTSLNKYFADDFFYAIFENTDFDDFRNECLQKTVKPYHNNINLSEWKKKTNNLDTVFWATSKIKVDVELNPKLTKDRYIKKYQDLMAVKRYREDKNQVLGYLWSQENNMAPIISAYRPLYSEDRTNAVIVTSIANAGVSCWFYRKKNDEWHFICEAEIALY